MRPSLAHENPKHVPQYSVRKFGARMGITCDRECFYWVQRVPQRYRARVGKSQFRKALWTDRSSEALRKAPLVEREVLPEWDALARNEPNEQRNRYRAARSIAREAGFAYSPIETLASGPLEALLERLKAALAPDRSPKPKETMEANSTRHRGVDTLLQGIPHPLLSAGNICPFRQKP